MEVGGGGSSQVWVWHRRRPWHPSGARAFSYAAPNGCQGARAGCRGNRPAGGDRRGPGGVEMEEVWEISRMDYAGLWMLIIMDG